MSKPPLIRMRYANLIKGRGGDGLLGFISSVNWNPIIEMGYFNRAMSAADGGEVNLYPKVIQISIEFKVIHADPLGFDDEGKTINGGLDPSNHKTNWPFKN